MAKNCQPCWSKEFCPGKRLGRPLAFLRANRLFEEGQVGLLLAVIVGL